ncbi:MAG: DNA topoisomerase III [Candidatus Sedimenticola sp. (ex Thyasira tokunagai)]
MTRLFLCEKPSQARDIGRVLGATQRMNGALTGDGVIVTWCIGHLLEMSPPHAYDPALKKWSFDGLPILPQHWRMEVTKNGRKQFNAVKACLLMTSEVVVATDADREGESIAREVLVRCKWQGPISRLWLSALDETSIRKALDNILPGTDTEPLYWAGLARSRADWLVGMNLTRAYTLAARSQGGDSLLSVGRVQTPTLKLIVDRDREIEAFKPVSYFDLIGHFSTDDHGFMTQWVPRGTFIDQEGRCSNRQAAIRLAQQLIGRRGRIDQAETRRKKEAAPLPFSLSALQQEASRRWGMGAQQVLNVAQALYETHKATTYPRTDCDYLPVSQHEEVSAILEALAQSDNRLAALVEKANPSMRSRCWNNAKITAHHAIIPTRATVNVNKLSESEFRLYDLIRRRYLAQFFPRYEYDQTIIEVIIGSECFRASGRTPRIDGWREVLGQETGKDSGNQPLPPVKAGQIVTLSHADVKERQTKPPARFTEGTLIQAMKTIGKTITDPKLKAVLKETAGLGTEATRAGILETLLNRGFVTKQKQHMVSTTVGQSLIDAVPKPVKDPATTAIWEQQLDAIAQGEAQLDDFLLQQTEHVRQLVEAVAGRDGAPVASLTGIARESHTCPACGKPLRRRKAKASGERFWGCSGYPDCKATLPDNKGRPGKHPKNHTARTPRSAPVKNPAAAGSKCPQCSTGKLLQRELRTGHNAGKPFIGCTNYPRCKFFSWPNNPKQNAS